VAIALFVALEACLTSLAFVVMAEAGQHMVAAAAVAIDTSVELATKVAQRRRQRFS